MLVVLLILLFLLFFGNLAAGSTRISFGQILEILCGHGENTPEETVILKIRLPRIFCAILVGGALSVSGYLLQTFFANPIAGPYILGISSGAKLCVALAMIFAVSAGFPTTSSLMVLSAFAGSLLSMGLVLLISLRVRNMSVLVVCGVMTGYICSAVTDLAVTFADDSNIVNLHNWSQGSFSGMSMNNALWMAALILPVVLMSVLLSKPIGAYLLGENYAASLGVSIRLLRLVLILLSSILTAAATAFTGPVSFVGIAVPHLVRTASRQPRPLVLIPLCFLGGAVLTLLCDGLARVLFAPTEVAASSVSACLLAPVVIVMMIRQRGGRRAF